VFIKANPTVIAAATSRQIIEMDVTDIIMNTDSYTITEEYCDLPVAKQKLVHHTYCSNSNPPYAV